MALAQLAVSDTLYNDNTFTPLYSDQKAWRIGDNVTLVIVESSSASTSADNSADSKLNLNPSLKVGGFDESVTASANNSSDNSGATGRKATFAAQVTATVEKIDDQGRLFVKADQQILINDEKQKIYLDGWLRRKDISSNNVALSTRLSDAHIEYDGYGEVSSSTKPGIIKRFFKALGLF